MVAGEAVHILSSNRRSESACCFASPSCKRLRCSAAILATLHEHLGMNKRRSRRKQERERRKQERFWRDVLRQQANSGQSVRAFCQERQIVASAFFSWQRQIKQCDRNRSAGSTTTVKNVGIEQSPVHPNRQSSNPTKPVLSARRGADVLQPVPAIETQSASRLAPWVATEKRYRLSDSTAVRVEVETESGGDCAKFDVELVDISQGGVRLRSENLVRKGESLTLTLSPKGFPTSLSARAKVCWTTLAPKGSHWLGCSIEPRIPQSLLDHLASTNILDRRHDARHEVSIALSASWELDPTAFDVKILNISRGGLCLLISQDGHLGDRIRLTLPGDNHKPTYILTTVCWQAGTKDGYLVGCSLSQRTAYEKLVRLANAQSPEAEPKPASPARRLFGR
jgi:hypothetical protein